MFWDRVPLCSSWLAWTYIDRLCWPRTHRSPPAFASQVLELKAWATILGRLQTRTGGVIRAKILYEKYHFNQLIYVCPSLSIYFHLHKQTWKGILKWRHNEHSAEKGRAFLNPIPLIVYCPLPEITVLFFCMCSSKFFFQVRIDPEKMESFLPTP